MNTEKNDKNLMYAVYAFIAVAIIAGLIIFITNDDGGMTGGAVLGQEGGSFWFSAIFFTLAAVAVLIFGLKSKYKIPSLIVAAICIALAWGKGCDDKANGGVTTEKGKIETFPH